MRQIQSTPSPRVVLTDVMITISNSPSLGRSRFPAGQTYAEVNFGFPYTGEPVSPLAAKGLLAAGQENPALANDPIPFTFGTRARDLVSTNAGRKSRHCIQLHPLVKFIRINLIQSVIYGHITVERNPIAQLRPFGNVNNDGSLQGKILLFEHGPTLVRGGGHGIADYKFE
ncbi:hypothetical protein TWF132_004649 [Orbilia oligospora]|nr:hypothetical protein TWF132_004649 [Orbilia oligospora]